MTVAELRYGSLKSREPDANLARVVAFLEPLTVLDFDAEAAAHQAEILWALRGESICAEPGGILPP
jgi:predicted nucleic acid-binding protein